MINRSWYTATYVDFNLFIFKVLLKKIKVEIGENGSITQLLLCVI